jgi:hypothetical protein
MKQAVEDASVNKLSSLVSILSELATVAKINKQKGVDECKLTPIAEEYIRDANKKAKKAAKKKNVGPDSDQGSASVGQISVADIMIEDLD